MAHIRPSRPDSSLGFTVKVLKPFQVVPSSVRIQRPQKIRRSVPSSFGSDLASDELFPAEEVGDVALLVLVERIWHIQDSQGKILALAARSKS